jgi:hypothetical protein
MGDDDVKIEPNVRLGLVDEMTAEALERARVGGRAVAITVFTGAPEPVLNIAEAQLAAGDEELVVVHRHRRRVDVDRIRRRMTGTTRRVLAIHRRRTG